MQSSPLPHFTAKQIRSQGQQYYIDDRGNQLPSVTTILNATRSAEQRERLANWQQRLGIAEASRITTTASRRGSGTHRQLQRYLQGESVACSEAIQPYWQSLEPVLQDIDAVRLVEGTVFHDELRYAGKLDCVASYQGIPCLCEWKTADRPKQTVDRLYDYPLQLVAYCGAANQLYQDYDLNLHHALLVIAVPDMPAEVFWFEPETLATYWQQWEQRVHTFWRRLGYFKG
ncbi:MAG: exonuclease [Scytolyngbya sp. HA4215-MV1]|jgi:genome maintenance exonuclease 1|nr:exonuclease [Scytolyngbya sp. HA4215-MV1]